jgi:Major Facilitator Superfamily
MAGPMGVRLLRPRRRSAPNSVLAHNWRRVQVDSVFLGVVTASGTFLPVFLLRLGATGNDIGLLTALPALTAFVLAIPFGRWMEARRNILPWYSRLRLLTWSSYALIALTAAILPQDEAVPVMLAIWALASVPSTAAFVAFPMVMDGAAGPGGRFDLLGRRWAIAGLSTAISVAVFGQLLNLVAFPTNFELLLVVVSVAGVGSYLQSSRIVIPDQLPVARVAGVPLRVRLRELWNTVRTNRPFTRFELRSLVYTASFGLAMPILPLFYVHELAAPDAWIGVIGAAQSAGGVLGYLGARQLARRFGGSMTLLPALLTLAAAPAILSVLGWLPAVAGVAFVMGVASAGAQLALFDQFMRRIPVAQGVTFSSVDQSVQNLALVITPNIGGLLAIALGIRASLIVVAVLGLAAFALFALEARAARRPTVPPLGSAPAAPAGRTSPPLVEEPSPAE